MFWLEPRLATLRRSWRAGSLSRLSSNARGSAAVVVALSLIPLCGLVGLVVDYGRTMRYKSAIDRVADAATLTAAKYANDKGISASIETVSAAAKAAGENFFKAAVTRISSDLALTATVNVTNSNGVWTAKLDYTGTVSSSFARLFGIARMPIANSTSASMSPGFPVLDIAMCVDSTGSMQPTLDTVKTNALNFYDNINAELAKKGMAPFPIVRVRMIYFKDYGGFGTNASSYGASSMGDPDPMSASNFFSLPSEASNFSSFVSPQVATGGGDTPESGLECLNTAIDSPWMKVGQVPSGFTQPVTDVYPIIVIWTDAPSHLPAYPDSLTHPLYPPTTTMPRDFAGLAAKWNDAAKIDQTHKQIVFFGDPNITAPDNYNSYASGWTTVETWPKFTVGGSLLDANTSMVELLATGIANGTKALRLTQ